MLMLHIDKAPSEYFSLEASSRSIEVIFATLSSPSETESLDSVMSRVETIRNEIMMKSNYGTSSHHSAGSVFAALYLPLIIEMETVIEVDIDIAPKSSAITRKSPSVLSRRAIQNSVGKIIANTEKLYGKEHAHFYLDSALKKSNKRKMEQNKNASDDDDNEDDDESSDEENDVQPVGEKDIMDDARVLNVLTSMPDKYVIFTEEDQAKIVALYGVVREVIMERDYKHPNYVAATETIKILQSCKYYSQITTRTILRWYDLKDVNHQKTGRKVDECFESEVWGNLILCVFNKKDDQVNVSKNVSVILNYFSFMITLPH